jgi:hypothetical protein
MAENGAAWILVLGVYAIGVVATLNHVIRVGRPRWDRRLLQAGAAIVWPVYWLAIPSRKARFRALWRHARLTAAAFQALLVAIGLRVIALICGVLAILVCALVALVALAVAVLIPARYLARWKTYWLEPIPDVSPPAAPSTRLSPDRLGRDVELQP